MNSALGNPALRRIEIGGWWLRTSSGAQNRPNPTFGGEDERLRIQALCRDARRASALSR